MTAQLIEPLTIPRVNGRHQDRALARARKTRAIQLRMTGMTYQQIADATGYANASSVSTIIKQAQEHHVASAVEDHRQIELDRLNALQSALWPAALRGGVLAVHEVVRIVEARARLLGLYRGPGKGPRPAAARPPRSRSAAQDPPGKHLRPGVVAQCQRLELHQPASPEVQPCQVLGLSELQGGPGPKLSDYGV